MPTTHKLTPQALTAIAAAAGNLMSVANTYGYTANVTLGKNDPTLAPK